MNANRLKYLIKTLLLFLLISYVIDKIVFFALNRISDQVYSGQSIGKLNHYLKIKDDLDLIVFGSSRSNHSIDPHLISENSFNMGMDGTLVSYSLSLIKLLPKNKSQVVLLHIDPNRFFDINYDGNDIGSLLTKYNRNILIKEDILRLKQGNIIQDFYWSLSYNGYVLGILKNYFIPSYDYKKYSGYDPLYVTENQSNILKEKLLYFDEKKCNQSLIVNEIYNFSLDEIKSFCDNNNKSLILFSSPVLNDNCKDDNLKFSEIMKSKGLTHYDFTDFFESNNSLKYWKDRTHLSNKGAEIFTREMMKELNFKK